MYFNDDRTVSFKSNEEKLWITSYVKLVKLSSFCCPLLLFIYFSVVSVDILLIELEMSQTKFAVIVFQEVVSTIGWLMVSLLGNWLISVTSNFLTCTIIKFIYYCNRSLLSISYFYSEIKSVAKQTSSINPTLPFQIQADQLKFDCVKHDLLYTRELLYSPTGF